MPYQFFVFAFNEEEGAIEDGPFRQLQDRARVKQVQASFFQARSGQAYWTVFVEYEAAVIERPESNLNETEKGIFQALRTWRNTKAETEGIPAYIIATNKQVEVIACLKDYSLEALAAIKGFGSGKAEKYGKEILALLMEKQANHENN